MLFTISVLEYDLMGCHSFIFSCFTSHYDSLMLLAFSLSLLIEFYRRWDAARHAAEERQRIDLIVPDSWAGWTRSLRCRPRAKTPHASEVPRRGEAHIPCPVITNLVLLSVHGNVVAFSLFLLFLKSNHSYIVNFQYCSLSWPHLLICDKILGTSLNIFIFLVIYCHDVLTLCDSSSRLLHSAVWLSCVQINFLPLLYSIWYCLASYIIATMNKPCDIEIEDQFVFCFFSCPKKKALRFSNWCQQYFLSLHQIKMLLNQLMRAAISYYPIQWRPYYIGADIANIC